MRTPTTNHPPPRPPPSSPPWHHLPRSGRGGSLSRTSFLLPKPSLNRPRPTRRRRRHL
uniref:Uncharacterized protein n=1 Tax=Arundo donax TaxID=35708 RepID=A0A0A8ZDY8_ARUDO